MNVKLIKKAVVLSIAVCGFVAHTNAQGIALKRYGVKAGVQVSTIKENTDRDSFTDLEIVSAVGYQIGGFATFDLPGKFSLQPELFLSAQGFTERSPEILLGNGDITEGYKHKYKVRYIKVPLLLRYDLIDRLSAEVGPQFGFFVSSNIDDVDWDIFKKFDIAGAVGLEYLLRDELGVQFRYAHSFASKSFEDYLWDSRKSRVFSLGLTYSF